MKYIDIRKNYLNSKFLNIAITSNINVLLSPFFTKIFLHYKIVPNTVTCMMIISGILGSLFYSLNNIISKIVGIVFIIVWFTLDCSDGQVARITKKYSKYGTEIDYVAHVINHPLFIISFIINCIGENFMFIVQLTLLCIFDLMFRNYLMFLQIKKMKDKDNEANVEKKVNESLKYKIIYWIKVNLTQFPSFAQLFPIVFLISKTIAFYYLSIFLLCTFISIFKNILSWVMYTKRS